MRKKKLFFAGAFLCLLVAALAAFYWYQKPRQNLVNVNPQYTLPAVQLYQEFSTNEEEANRKYIEKVILVEGEIEQVHSSDSTLTIVLKAGSIGGVNCTFSSNHPTPNILPLTGERIKIKGKCIGYLMDVNIIDAIIESN